MKVRYFADTDTVHIELQQREIAESRDLDENTLIEFDAAGKLCAITVEHAREHARLAPFFFRASVRLNAAPCDLAHRHTCPFSAWRINSRRRYTLEIPTGRQLGVFLLQWARAKHQGCRSSATAGQGTLSEVEFRFDDNAGLTHMLSLRATLREGKPVIEVVDGPVF